MSGVLGDMITSTVTVKRRIDAGEWVNGRWEDGEIEEIEMDASVQQATPNELMMLPEAVRTRETLKIYAEEELRISDEKAGIKADSIVHNGKEYQVQKVDNWSYGNDLPHYKAICVKIDGQGG